jgi:hypothetical protein
VCLSSALTILAAARGALESIDRTVRDDVERGRAVQLEGWILSRTEAEIRALTLLPMRAFSGSSANPTFVGLDAALQGMSPASVLSGMTALYSVRPVLISTAIAGPRQLAAAAVLLTLAASGYPNAQALRIETPELSTRRVGSRASSAQRSRRP